MASSFDTVAAQRALCCALVATFAACAAQPTARPSAYSSRDAQLLGSPQWQSNFDDRPDVRDDVMTLDAIALDERDVITVDAVIDTSIAPDSTARSGSIPPRSSAGTRGTPANNQGSTRRYNRE